MVCDDNCETDVNEWISEWINEWMNQWMIESKNQRMNHWKYNYSKPWQEWNGCWKSFSIMWRPINVIHPTNISLILNIEFIHDKDSYRLLGQRACSRRPQFWVRFIVNSIRLRGKKDISAQIYVFVCLVSFGLFCPQKCYWLTFFSRG